MKYKYVKRFFDFIFALFGLILLSPLLLLVSFIILFFDGRPIFFKQYRIGYLNRKFIFYKFRSMPVNTEITSSDKIKNIKISQVGKIIRRLSIDELPQLLNILKGDMSFVGPRPCIESQVELIRKRKLNGSFKLRPGLTGFAQIRAYDFMPVNQKVRFDEIYLNEFNIFFDLYILFSTFFYLLKSPPKY